jgi:hypothetical protein
MNNDNNEFDFNIGHIVKSPCIKCQKRFKFPSCIDSCKILDELRTVLAKSVSSSYSSYES